MQAAEAKDKKETAGAGKGAGARNTAALDDMATMWDGIVSCSPVGTGGGESALQASFHLSRFPSVVADSSVCLTVLFCFVGARSCLRCCR